MTRVRGKLNRINRRRSSRGLTLVELMVVVTIIAIMMSLLLTALSKVRSAAKSVVCKNKLQTVGQEFSLFAGEYTHVDRGRESDRLGSTRFRLEDFQDRIYATEEFLDLNLPPFSVIPYRPAELPLMCPAGPQVLSRETSPEPALTTIKPLSNVSIGFNMRLHRASLNITFGSSTFPVLRDVTLTAAVLDHPWTPLAFDVDGTAARNRPSPLEPFYSAPGDANDGMYANDAFWFPASRHGGMTHAVFIGGHVWSATHPKSASGWDWAYQPAPDL